MSVLVLTKGAIPNSANVGDTITWIVALSNFSATPTVGTMIVTDHLPTGIKFQSANYDQTNWTLNQSDQTLIFTSSASYSLPYNEQTTFTISTTATAAAILPGQTSTLVTNNSNATGGGSSTQPTAGANALITGTVSFNLTKVHNGPLVPGQNGTYTIILTNTGNIPTTEGTITLTDTLPVSLSYVSAVGQGWSFTNVGPTITGTSNNVLNPGDSNTIVLTVAVDPAASGQVTNTATLTGGGSTDVVSASDTTTFGQSMLSLSKNPTEQMVQTGTPISWELVVGNTGNVPTSNVITVTDTLPLGMSFISVSGTNWVCSVTGQTVSCNSNQVVLPGDSSSPIDLTAIVGNLPSGIVSEPFVNKALASGGDAGNVAVAAASVIVVRQVALPGPVPSSPFRRKCNTCPRRWNPGPTPTPLVPISRFVTTDGSIIPGSQYSTLTFALVGGGGAGVGAGGATGGVIVYGTVPIVGSSPVVWTLGIGSTGENNATSSLLSYTGPRGFTVVTANSGLDSTFLSYDGANAVPQVIPVPLSYIMLGGGGGAEANGVGGSTTGAAGISIGSYSEAASPGVANSVIGGGNGAGLPNLPSALLSLLPTSPAGGGAQSAPNTSEFPAVFAGGGGAGLAVGGTGGDSYDGVVLVPSSPGIYGSGGGGALSPQIVAGGNGALVFVIM